MSTPEQRAEWRKNESLLDSGFAFLLGELVDAEAARDVALNQRDYCWRRGVDAGKRAKEAEAENAKLREALEKIAQWVPRESGSIESAKRFASLALKAKP